MFRYEELPSGDDYIRRLILEPGEGDAPLVGRLEHIKLRDAGALSPFKAISYVWGSSIKDQTITLDGERLGITTSLRNSLSQARHVHTAVALWADGICINQDDDEEKNRQVVLMGRIYESSLCTLVCLGPGLSVEDRQCASDLAGLIAEVETEMKAVFEEPNFSWDCDSFPFPFPDDPFLHDHRWTKWERLLEQPWFERGWVVQEVAFAPNALVLWAGEAISWVSVLRVDYWLMYRAKPVMISFDLPLLSDVLYLGPYNTQHPDEARTFWPEHLLHCIKPNSLLELLDTARQTQLTDQKDRIYAFMALETLDNAMPAVQPNYRKDVSYLDVYKDFAIKYLEKTSDLDILRFVVNEAEENSTSSVAAAEARMGTIPSWVPRWDCGRDVPQMGDRGFRRIRGVQGEHGNSRGFSISVMDGNTVLRVKGIVFDSVKYVSEVIDAHRGASERAVTQIVSLWRDLSQQSGKYPGPHHSISSLAFLGALSLGLYDGDQEEFFQDLQNFARYLHSDQPSHPVDSHAQDPAAQRTSLIVSDVSKTRRFVLLGRGYYGVGPETTCEGDLCAIIFGTRTPFILRRVPSKPDQYSVVGTACVMSKKLREDSGTPYNLAEKESCDDWKDWNLQTEDIMLV